MGDRVDNDTTDTEIGTRVAELAAQVDETRKQLIKTSNILGNLTAEVKAVGRAQQQDRRGLSLNSAAAYVLFVLLVASGFYFLYRGQVDRLDAEKDALVREHAAALTKLAALREAEEKRRRAEDKAAAFYRLSQSGQLHRALDQYPEVSQLPLSRVEAAVFQDWVARVKSRIAYTSYAEGMKAVGDKQWKQASAEFRTALKYIPHPPLEASLRYYFGVALMKLGSYREAAEELERALGVGAEKAVSHEIRYYLGTIYEQTARREKAVAAYKAYVKRFPATSYARVARRRIKELE